MISTIAIVVGLVGLAFLDRRRERDERRRATPPITRGRA
jgi:hypothetical protein